MKLTDILTPEQIQGLNDNGLAIVPKDATEEMVQAAPEGVHYRYIYSAMVKAGEWTNRTCYRCKHYEWAEADSSDGHPDQNAGHVCGARHGVQNLKQFPFMNTDCEHFET